MTKKATWHVEGPVTVIKVGEKVCIRSHSIKNPEVFCKIVDLSQKLTMYERNLLDDIIGVDH